MLAGANAPVIAAKMTRRQEVIGMDDGVTRGEKGEEEDQWQETG